MSSFPTTMGEDEPVRTSLFNEHVSLGGNIVDFHGFELPIWYSNIKEEHLSTRNGAGLFDVSHMGVFKFTGSNVKQWLESIATQKVTSITPSRCAYTHFLDDDGAGNLRLYYLSGTTRVYTDSTYGTVDYATGEVILTSAHITSISNVDGATSTQIRVFATPSSNDVVPVRNQILSIDTSNSTITGEVDGIESGSSQAGTTYTTTSSYS